MNHLVVIGDDMPAPGTSCGPSMFHEQSIVDGLKRCHGTVLQVASFQPNVMAGIALRMLAGHSIMIVECSTKREDEWSHFLMTAKAPNIMVVTEDLSKYLFDLN